METPHVGDCAFQCGDARGGYATHGGVDLGCTDAQCLGGVAVEAQRVFTQCRVALFAHARDDCTHRREDFAAVVRRGARERGAAPSRVERRPVEDLQAHASIFSTGSTSSELAPAFFRLSRVSQNTFSRHTA